MASRLTEDQIKWILTLDASAAEKEINSLIKVNKELQEANKGVQKEMRQLEAAGKKESDEYRNLNGVLRENNNTLRANREQIKRLENQMGLANLSMSQLRRRAQDLESQMNRTSRNLHPEEWNKLQKELTETRSKIDELKKAGKQAEESLGKSILMKGGIAGFLGNMGTKVAEFVGGLISGMKDLVAEGINMAAAADGVTRAFEVLDRPDLLDNLRKATKGTVNDLELMKAANMAKDFRIPLEDLGKYLEFAQLKAQQTGQSVEYMTNSIVTGLGRKSVLILDNLGLSAAEINEQMAKTGDFMSAVASIVDKQLAEAGGSYISEADKMAQRTVKLQNAQMKLGETLLPLKQNLDATFGSFKIGLLEATGWVVKNRAAIISAVLALTSFITAQKLVAKATAISTAIVKAQEVVMSSVKAVTLLFAAAKAKLTGNITRATAAMKLFNAITKMNPVGLLIGTLTAAATAFMTFRNRTSETMDILSEANRQTSHETSTLNRLRKVIHDSSKSYDERKAAILEIQKIVPEYHGSLTEEGKLINDNSDALDNYVKKLKLSAMTEIASRKLVDAENKRDEYIKSLGDDAYRYLEVKNAASDSKYDNENQAAVAHGMSPTVYKAINKKLGKLKSDVEKYENLINSYMSDLFKIDNSSKSLSGDRKNVNDNKASKSPDSMSADVSANDNAYKARLLSIKQNREKENLTDEEYNLQNLKAEREFLDEKLKILKMYYQREKDTKKRDSIAGQISDTESKGIDIDNRIDRAEIDNVKAKWTDRMAQEEEGYRQLKLQFTKQLADQKITKEQYDVAILALEEEELKTRLTLQKEYLNELTNLEVQNGRLKAEIVREAGNEVLKIEQQVEDKRAEQGIKMSSLLKDFKDQFNLTDQENETDTQLKFLESVYKARKAEAQKQGLDTTELDAVYERVKTNILLKGEQERANIRQQYGIFSMQEEYQLQMDMLEQQYAQGLLKEEEYQQAKTQLQVQRAKGYFDTYSGLASNAVEALQQAELDQIDAKYDVAIEAAQGNAEEVERLENEKAQKKLDVQKKYADVNFAIKISQIIADTAVAIMQAYAQLGPIGGSIAAAFMAATGAAQIVSAKAERDKVKNMKLNTSSSSSSSSSSFYGERVVTGRESGGYIDVKREQDGKRYKAALSPKRRGYIGSPTVIVGDGPVGKSREWVASNDAVSNPTIRPLLDMIDSAQRSGTVRTVDMNLLMRQRMAGFENGGFIGSAARQNPDYTYGGERQQDDLSAIISETRDLLLYLKSNGIEARSFWSLTDFDKIQQRREASEKPFTRKY
ncbi:hypothetical protein [Coprobacter fastidiosus]|uniref:hypothetical protein n=1 Tax=Coprobacter fastidiosus TaxID=1099853 RepID=UPI002674E2FB|nr:hypothetical protein [Coprobacter fastidiosus]